MRFRVLCTIGALFLAIATVRGQGVYQGGFDHFEGTGTSGCDSNKRIESTSSNPFVDANIFTCQDLKVRLSVNITINTPPSTSTPTGDGQMLFLNGETLRTIFKMTATVTPANKSFEPYKAQVQALSFTGYSGASDKPPVECDSPVGTRTSLVVGDSVDLPATADCTWPKIYGATLPPGASLFGLQFPAGGLLGLIRFRALVLITNGNNGQTSIREEVDGALIYYSQTATTIEAVQVVLTGNGVGSYLRGTGDKSIPLIAGKSTVVRVFPIVATSDPIPPVTGVLHVSRSGTPLGDVDPKNGPVRPAQMIDRNNENASLNFHLPIDWTNGDLEVTAELKSTTPPPPSSEKPEPPPKTMFHFVTQPRRFNIKYLPYCYKPPGGQLSCPSAKIADYYGLVQKLFPVADKNGISYTPVFGQSPIWTKDLQEKDSKGNLIGPGIFIAHLRRLYMLFQALAPALGDQVGDQLVAWLPGGAIPQGSLAELAGSSDPPWSHPATVLGGAVGHVSFDADVSDVSGAIDSFFGRASDLDPQKSLAHEIAHNLGLRHTNTRNQGGNPDSHSCFPYGDAAIQLPAFDAKNDRFIPKSWFDLMSYNRSDMTWVSPYTYDVLLRGQFNPHGDEINRGCGGPALSTPQEDAAITGDSGGRPADSTPVTSDVLIITGRVDTGGASTLGPGYRITTTSTPDTSDPSGQYCLRFMSNSSTLSDFCFNLSFTDVETGATTGSESFSFQVVFPAATTRIALRSGTQELASLAVPAHAPSISITSPPAGGIWNGGQQTLTWTASHPDGASLLFAVQYSYDGGQNYIPLELDITERQFAIDPSQIVGGSKVFFRVLATDGVNTTAATAGPIQVQQGPRLQVAASTLDFGNTTPGSSIERRLSLSNTGSGPLTVTSLSFDNAMFSYTGSTLPLIIRAGGQISIPLRFAPLSALRQTGVMTISSDAGPAVSVQLAGQGFSSPVSDVEVAPGAVDFGSVALGQSRDRLINVASMGSADLQVLSVSISNPQFAVPGLKVPLTIPSGTEQQFTVRFTPATAGAQNGTLTIATNDPAHPTRTISLTGSSGDGASGGQAPQIGSNAVVNAASFQTAVGRGSLATVFGANLATSTAQADRIPLPSNLGGVSVTVAGTSAPVFYVSPTQINFQVPYETPAGAAGVVVTRDGVQSNSVTVNVADAAPGIFTYARTSTALDPVIVHADNRLITPSNPAAANEVLIIYATGIGALNNQPATGSAAPSLPLATARANAAVMIGGSPVQVLFAGLAPGFVGLAQINVRLPSALPAGSMLPLVVQFGSAASQSVNLSVLGQMAPSPSISATPASLDFGSVATGQTKDVALTLRNSGAASLTVNSVTSSNTRFSVVALTTPFTLAANSSRAITIRYAPAAVGAQTGTLTIASSDPARASFGIPLSGSGTAATSNDIVLKVDGGDFDSIIGYPKGTAAAYFVNRLTPPSYPATIRSVQIYFSKRSDGLALNAPLTVVSATNPSGSSTLSVFSAGSIDVVQGAVTALDTFVTYTVPQRTITSGDFVVGFTVQNPANIYPGEVDTITGSQHRSYVSGDAQTFILLDSISRDIAGNLGIRAVVTVGANTPGAVDVTIR